MVENSMIPGQQHEYVFYFYHIQVADNGVDFGTLPKLLKWKPAFKLSVIYLHYIQLNIHVVSLAPGASVVTLKDISNLPNTKPQ